MGLGFTASVVGEEPGGGDTPESGLEALDAAFDKADWGVDDGYHRQVVILRTDAPYLIGDYSDVTLENLEAKSGTLSPRVVV